MEKSRVLILINIKIDNIFLGAIVDDSSSQKDVEDCQEVFKDLHSDYDEISSSEAVVLERVDLVQGNVRNVIARIRNMIGPELITPYMHVMDAHFADIIRLNGCFFVPIVGVKKHAPIFCNFPPMKGGGRGNKNTEKQSRYYWIFSIWSFV